MGNIKNKLLLLEEAQEDLQLGIWEYNTSSDRLVLSDTLLSILNINNKNITIEAMINKIYDKDNIVAKTKELFFKAINFGEEFNTKITIDINNNIRYFSLYCKTKRSNDNYNLYGFMQDITNNELEVEEQKRLLNLTDQYVIISQTDLDGKMTYVSQAFADISGYTKKELLGKKHNILRHPDMKDQLFKDMWAVVTKGKSWSGEVKNLKKDGGFYWVHSHIEVIKNSKDEIIGYQSVRQDITNKKLIEQNSITDDLTQLFNRRHFNIMLKNKINHSRRTGEKLVFAMLDVDNFKKYNDTYGHQKGDTVLISIAKSLTKTFRRSHDIIFRLGGEEFGILFHIKEDKDAAILLEQARSNIEKLKIEHKQNNPKVVTASFGLLIIDNNYNNSIEQEMKRIYNSADELLYKAKKNGRNRVESNLN